MGLWCDLDRLGRYVLHLCLTLFDLSYCVIVLDLKLFKSSLMGMIDGETESYNSGYSCLDIDSRQPDSGHECAVERL